MLGCQQRNHRPAPPIRLDHASVDTRALPPGATQLYSLDLAAGEVAHLRVAQRDLDIEIQSPQLNAESIDLPHGSLVTEDAWWVAEEAQTVEITIESLGGPGTYQLTVAKGTSPVDHQRARAYQLELESRHQRGKKAWGRALELLRAARAAWQGTDMPHREALTLAMLADALETLGQDALALTARDQAVALARSSPERSLGARLLLERGLLHKESGRLEAARRDNDAARDVARAIEDPASEARAHNNNAVISDIEGDLQAACAGFERARQTFESVDAYAATRAQANLGHCYLELGASQESLVVLLAAQRAAQRLPGATALRAKVSREIGWWFHLEGDPRQAIRALARSLELSGNHPATLDRLGTIYTSRGAYSLAHAVYRRSYANARSDIDKANARLNLCRLDLSTGAIDAGVTHCTDALRTLEELNAADTLAQAHLLLAKLERHRDLTRAEASARRALALIESHRPRFARAAHRTAFLAARLEAHHLTIDLRMALAQQQPDAGWAAQALAVADLTRARSLLESLTARQVAVDTHPDPQLEASEARLLGEHDALARDLATIRLRGDRPTPEDDTRLQALSDRLARIRRQLAEDAPSYSALVQPQPLDIPRLRALLDPQTALIAFHFSTDLAYAWLVSKEAVVGVSLGAREPIERLATSWHELLTDASSPLFSNALAARQARRLSQKLLGPIAHGLDAFPRLLFVPDGTLLRIPFSALPSPADPDARGARPLIVDHEVLSLPSAGVLDVLARQRANRLPAPKLLAVVANPSYRSYANPSDPRYPGYSSLAGSAEEGRALVALVPTRASLLLEQDDASRERVISGELSDYRIVHFATHADTFDAPGRSIGLVLSQTASVDPTESILGLPELYALDLPAELVVLSACGTALGEEIPGEGLVGLTRGFMHAGAQRVLVSLWAIRDHAARDLMERFYRYLLIDRLSPGESLRRAQLAMLADGRPARDWAAFVLQGDWRAFSLAF